MGGSVIILSDCSLNMGLGLWLFPIKNNKQEAHKDAGQVLDFQRTPPGLRPCRHFSRR